MSPLPQSCGGVGGDTVGGWGGASSANGPTHGKVELKLSFIFFKCSQKFHLSSVTASDFYIYIFYFLFF